MDLCVGCVFNEYCTIQKCENIIKKCPCLLCLIKSACTDDTNCTKFLEFNKKVYYPEEIKKNEKNKI